MLPTKSCCAAFPSISPAFFRLWKEAATAPNALAKLIDRLLASPQYGERWARHWLDLARYAWRYRDYVIDVFNKNMPYNYFVLEQITGDLICRQAASCRRRRCLGNSPWL